jgi:hypothetical protein
LTAASAEAGAPQAPAFSDFAVKEAALVAPAQVNLASHPEARRYRTLLRRAKLAPNLGGHFTGVTVGCGSACAFLIVIDRKTGRVFFPSEFGAMVWGVEDVDDYGFAFKADSRLVRACGDPGESGKSACRFYEWTGTAARLVGQIPWGAVDPGDGPDGGSSSR